jgi:hypothetical protein
MKRWVDLDELRRDIAAEVKARAMAAGLEGVRVYVRIADPDRRGARVIDVSVDYEQRALAVRAR